MYISPETHICIIMSALHFLGSISVLKAGHHPALCPLLQRAVLFFFHSANIYWVLTYLTTIVVVLEINDKRGTALAMWLIQPSAGLNKLQPRGHIQPDFVNKVSLEQSHTHLSTCFLWLFKKKKKLALLRYSPHTTRFTLLNFTIQWFFVCSELCDCQNYLILDHFRHPQKKLRALQQSPTPSPSHQSLETAHKLHASIDLLILDVSCKLNRRICRLLCLALFHSASFSRFIHVAQVSTSLYGSLAASVLCISRVT